MKNAEGAGDASAETGGNLVILTSIDEDGLKISYTEKQILPAEASLKQASATPAIEEVPKAEGEAETSSPSAGEKVVLPASRNPIEQIQPVETRPGCLPTTTAVVTDQKVFVEKAAESSPGVVTDQKVFVEKTPQAGSSTISKTSSFAFSKQPPSTSKLEISGRTKTPGSSTKTPGSSDRRAGDNSHADSPASSSSTGQEVAEVGVVVEETEVNEVASAHSPVLRSPTFA
ncbi:unnamed protein product [Amoebophrya sp. A25]|nr:unnamed protein product [Amoebophrya sp. A25]|eukprot:GSA25T00026909001.1